MMIKYTSPSTGKSVTFPQFFAELLVARKAKQDGVKLPIRYWSNPEYILWTKEFKSQLFGTNKLLKIFDPNIILKTFLQNDWVYSAHSPTFHKLIEEEKRKSKNKEKTNVNIVESTDSKPIKFGKPSRKNKLE